MNKYSSVSTHRPSTDIFNDHELQHAYDAARFKLKRKEPLTDREYEILDAGYIKLEDMATEDELTGLLNPRGFRHQLDRALSTVGKSSYKTDIALITFDCDHFKRFNDTRSHEEGDIYLKAIGQYLQGSFKGGDIVARNGGDEFNVIAYRIHASQIKQRLNHVVDGFRTATKHIDPSGIVGLSAGITMAAPGINAAEFKTRSEDAMYDAKYHGRGVAAWDSSIDYAPIRAAMKERR